MAQIGTPLNCKCPNGHTHENIRVFSMYLDTMFCHCLVCDVVFEYESAPNKVLQSDGGEVLPAHKHLYIDGRCACGRSINRRR